MDSLTHILTGVALGQLFSGEKDRSKPLIWGAIAGSIPDLDTVFQPFISTESSMLFHRGFSHSLLLWALCSPLLALLINRIYKGDRRSYFKWLKISATAWLSHLLLDLFNTYGTGIFEPFSHARIAYDAVNVFDLLYLIPVLLISVLYIFIIKKHIAKFMLAALALLFSVCYISFSAMVKFTVETTAEIQCIRDDISPKRILSSPLPLSNLAWKVVIDSGEGYYAGVYYGFWKKRTKFDYIPKNESLEKRFEAYDSFRKLKRFTKDWYVFDETDGKVTLYDLRFSSLNREKYVIGFPLEIKENSLKIERTSLNRHVTFRNIKDFCRQLTAKCQF
ncbi:MAG: metal-dependent hydrolase [Prevotellaceae bacterium]|jgi:inner membrane protein|nr:metal-dependent hydrolase [Prevotellaceae bacterium]